MNIQPISIADIPDLLGMAAAAHGESKYSHLPFSPNSVAETFHQHIAQGFAIKAVKEGDIAGFFIGAPGALVFSSMPISLETSYYVKPEYRGTRCFYLLMKAFMDWSENRPQLLMPHFGRDNTKIYSAVEKLGFVEAGRIYTRGI